MWEDMIFLFVNLSRLQTGEMGHCVDIRRSVFTVFRLLTDFVCLYNYEFGLSLCKIVRSSVILLLPLFRLLIDILLTVIWPYWLWYEPIDCDMTLLTVIWPYCSSSNMKWRKIPSNNFIQLYHVDEDYMILSHWPRITISTWGRSPRSILLFLISAITSCIDRKQHATIALLFFHLHY